MKRFLLPLALLALVAGEADAQAFPAWSKYRTITINTAATGGGAGVTEANTNVPILVRLNNLSTAAGANVLSEALAGGADIRFTNGAGDTAYPHQIERWTASGADIWVKVPLVAANGNTTLRIYWGNSAATNASNGPAVFDTTQGYTAVWHMNGAGSGGLVDELDATGGGLTAAQFNSSGTNAASSDVGGIGYYRILTTDGSTGQGFTTSNVARGAFLNTQAFTISSWVNPTSVEHTPYPTIISKHDNLWSLRTNTNVAGPWLFFVGNGGNWPEAQSSEMAVLGQWQHVVGVRSLTPDAMTIYVNGVMTGTTASPASGGTQNNTTSIAIGRRSEQADRFWNGAIGELRVESVARSAARVKLEYETQKPGATALTLGATLSAQARALYYPSKKPTYAQNVAIENNVPVVTGTATSFSINNTLPAGLSFSTTTGTISGTPTTITAAAQYIVTVNLQGGGTGLDTLTIAVAVGTSPGAPTNVTAVAGAGQATVSWTAPLSIGSGAILSYKARAVQDTAKNCTWTTGPLSCVITGLTNGTAYTFTVTASNGAGAGAASAASAAVTPATVPGAPTGVTAIQVGQSARVTWIAPASNGGAAITSYTATSTPGSGSCTTTGTTCDITSGLTIGTSYTITVRATNSAGAGTVSAGASFSPVGILPGSFTLKTNGYARPFTFVFSKEALESKEAFTMSILDAWGRSVWSRTVNPSKDGTRELTWNGRNASGQAASAGVYVVRVSGAGSVTNIIQKTITP
ncbi:MAG: fibronectin [Fibrobacteria bacterium]|nr:fibronectin [Fibrobacteria bacterium]